MDMNVLFTYEAPQVEVIEVEVEKGFALSGNGTTQEGNPGTSVFG